MMPAARAGHGHRLPCGAQQAHGAQVFYGQRVVGFAGVLSRRLSQGARMRFSAGQSGAQRVRVRRGQRLPPQRVRVCALASETQVRHHPQAVEQRHAPQRKALRVPQRKERGQFKHRIRAAAQRHLRTRPFGNQRRLSPLGKISAHRADNVLAPRQLPDPAQMMRMAVMEGVIFTNNAANPHGASFQSEWNPV